MEIATKWSKVLKTGSIEVKFMAIDFVTIMFTLQRGQDVLEVSDLCWVQSLVEVLANKLTFDNSPHCSSFGFWFIFFWEIVLPTQLREFLLKQPEAYEVKIGDQAYRRPGDPPLDKVIQKLQNENNKDDADDGRAKQEL